MIHETVQLYEDREEVKLVTYVNQIFSEGPQKIRRPAILICPGGGYLGLAPGEGEPVALAFASRGYAAFVLHYSTYGEGKGFPEIRGSIPRKDSCIFPNPMLDIGAAFSYITENADAYSVDPEQLVVCGFSAGGHNAAMYSVYWKKYGLPEPRAAILGYPVTDFRESFVSPMDDAMHMAIAGMEELDEACYKELSALEHVSQDTPPMFLWATSQDRAVPCRNSLLMAMKLSEAKVPFELHIFEKGPHALSLANAASTTDPRMMRPDVAEWVGLAETWLKKHVEL